jgi:hypothetical protein
MASTCFQFPISNLSRAVGIYARTLSARTERTNWQPPKPCSPYLRLLKAGLQNKDTTPLVEEIAQLPLEKRYIWRIASALKWGFADFDSVYVPVDRETLSAEDLGKVIELLRLRPLQFCIFLRALVGAEAMERMMSTAIAGAKQEG